MWPRRIFRVLNKLFGNFACMAVLLPSFLPKSGKSFKNLVPKCAKIPFGFRKFTIRHKKMVEKSNFGEKLPNFFNVYIDFFAEMHKIIKKLICDTRYLF